MKREFALDRGRMETTTEERVQFAGDGLLMSMRVDSNEFYKI